MKFIELTKQQEEYLDFTTKDASELLFQDIVLLLDWCSMQDDNMFIDLSLQELLNLYRISHNWEDFDMWFNEEPKAALNAYNAAVDESNRMFEN